MEGCCLAVILIPSIYLDPSTPFLFEEPLLCYDQYFSLLQPATIFRYTSNIHLSIIHYSGIHHTPSLTNTLSLTTLYHSLYPITHQYSITYHTPSLTNTPSLTTLHHSLHPITHHTPSLTTPHHSPHSITHYTLSFSTLQYL